MRMRLNAGLNLSLITKLKVPRSEAVRHGSSVMANDSRSSRLRLNKGLSLSLITARQQRKGE